MKTLKHTKTLSPSHQATLVATRCETKGYRARDIRMKASKTRAWMDYIGVADEVSLMTDEW